MSSSRHVVVSLSLICRRKGLTMMHLSTISGNVWLKHIGSHSVTYHTAFFTFDSLAHYSMLSIDVLSLAGNSLVNVS